MKVLIVEDLTHTRERTASILMEQYPGAEIIEASTLEDSLELVLKNHFDLLVVDLGIPKAKGDESKLENGIQFLRQCMEKHQNISIAVQSAEPKALIRIKKSIDLHQGGFTVIDKTLSTSEMLRRIVWATEGIIHIRDVRGLQAGIELKPEWLKTLVLASSGHSLQDKEIATKLNVTEATIRHYWRKIQDALEIYPDTYHEKKNLRVYTLEQARQTGLID